MNKTGLVGINFKAQNEIALKSTISYRLSEKGVQTLVWQNQAKAWTPERNLRTTKTFSQYRKLKEIAHSRFWQLRAGTLNLGGFCIYLNVYSYCLGA
jgi:hypothetical protein